VKDPHWAIHSHHYAKDWQGYPIGMCVALWGIHLNITDPKQGRGFGWKTDEWLAYYPREFALTSTLAELRYKLEMYLGAYSQFEMQHTGKSRYACGLGRIGADFWLVLKDKRGRIHDSLAGRYPESYWGQLNLNYCLPYILGKGPDGPLATIRSEAFREGIQDAEVRIYIEKGFMLDDRKEKVGQAAADSYRQMLDERIRLVNRAGGVRSDQTNVTEYLTAGLAANWQESSVKLYEAADEIARKLGQ
jgi:hypothetical protein